MGDTSVAVPIGKNLTHRKVVVGYVLQPLNDAVFSFLPAEDREPRLGRLDRDNYYLINPQLVKGIRDKLYAMRYSLIKTACENLELLEVLPLADKVHRVSTLKIDKPGRCASDLLLISHKTMRYMLNMMQR